MGGTKRVTGESTYMFRQALAHRGFGELSAAETLGILRWLSDVLMESPLVRAKINEHVDRMARLSLGDKKRAEAQDRAVVESLGVSGESRKRLRG